MKKIKKTLCLFWIKIKIRFIFRSLFKSTKNIIFISEQIIKTIRWNEGDLNFFTVNLLSRNLHKLKSIQILIKNGLSKDTFPLIRSMVESTLDYDYITKNPEKLNLYIQYSAYLDLKNLNRMSKTRDLSVEELEIQKYLEKEWNTFKNTFKNKKGKIRASWRDNNSHEIARLSNMKNLSNLYSQLCDNVHDNSNLTKEFISGVTPKGLYLITGCVYNKNEITKTLTIFSILFLHTLMLANKNFDLNFNIKLKKEEKRILKTQRKLS